MEKSLQLIAEQLQRISEKLQQKNDSEKDYEAIVKRDGRRTADKDIPCITIDSDSDDEAQDNMESEANDGEENDEDYLMDDEDSTSGTTDEDSSDATTVDDDDDAEEEQTADGPSTSTGRRSTRQLSKRQSGAEGQSKPSNNVKKTEKLSVITQKLKCTVPGCTKVVKSRKSLNRHLLSSHQFKEYRCLMRRCHAQKSASFSTRSELTTHRRKVHGNLSNWTCICSKKFVTYVELHTHYWLNHELGHFVCSAESCTFRSTSTRASVEAHQRCHDETLKYQCSVDGCSGRFKSKGDLDKHTLIHSGKRSFLCPECDKPFNQKGDLTRHLRIHLNDKCYHCTWPRCAHSATNRSAVLQHIRTIHFQLPRTVRQQIAKGIKDARDARQYLTKVKGPRPSVRDLL